MEIKCKSHGQLLLDFVVDWPRINLLRLFISAAGQVWDPKPSPESHQMELFKITLITELNGRKSIENLSISICISLQNATDCGDDGGGLWAGSKNNTECEVHNCIVRGVVTLTATAATDEWEGKAAEMIRLAYEIGL